MKKRGAAETINNFEIEPQNISPTQIIPKLAHNSLPVRKIPQMIFLTATDWTSNDFSNRK